MAKNYWKLINKVIDESDVIMIVLDARFYKESINKDIEKLIKEKNKKFLYVINKIDMLTFDKQKEIKLNPSIQVSAAQRLSTTRLLKKLLQFSNGRQITVGVLGYPNTGKSSIINALKGRHSAKASSESGYTKGLQKIRVHKRILLIDSPGVFPRKEFDEVKHTLISAKDITKIKDPELAAMEIIKELNGKVEEYYDVPISSDLEKTLELIALKKKALKKGAIPDTTKIAKQIILEFQKGNIS